MTVKYKIIERRIIIDKLTGDLNALKYFLHNSKIIRLASNIIPILYEYYDYLYTIIKYADIWILENLNGLCRQWIKNSKTLTHDMHAIIYNKNNIRNLAREEYTSDFNPYDINREWFLPSNLLN